MTVAPDNSGFEVVHGDPTVDELRDQRVAAEQEDFDRFWAGHAVGGKVLANVLGMDLQLVRSVPLRFELEARRLQTSTRSEDVRHLFGMLFGEGTYDALVERGMDAEQFGLLLVWGSANAVGRAMTLAQARVEYGRRLVAAARGKAPTPDRGATSSGTGHSSKPTSRGSTSSRRKRSRR